MKIIPLSAIRSELTRICPQGVNMPSLTQSDRVLVVSRDYFVEKFGSFFAEYRKSRDVTYFNPGMCEVFAALAFAEFSLMVNREASLTGLGDLAGGLWKANVEILSGQLNGVSDGAHATAIVALEDDNAAGFTLHFWEPQQPIYERTRLTAVETACGSNPVRVLLCDLGF